MRAARLPAERSGVPVLLGTQLLFNVGFYAVVPFLALVLTEDFRLAGAAVGLVLGLRTFAQQGMFLAGGVLADRFGARSIILLGCAVRATGFFTLAASLWPAVPLLWLFVLGTVLTGLGGALFSPGLNTLVAASEADRARSGPRRRVTLFAWLSFTGEIGAVVGPLLGAVLLDWGFAMVAVSGAGFFAAIGMLLWRTLPTGEGRRVGRADDGGRRRGRPWPVLRDRRFVAYAALHSADLLAYNQLYLTLPLELRGAGAAPQTVGLLFAWVSILILVLQLPVARVCARIGAPAALRAGYATGATGFLGLAGAALLPLSDGERTAAVLAAASLVTLGHLIANPTALSIVPRFADGHASGSYFGLLATFGGLAVLVGNLVSGGLLGSPATGPAAAVLPWCFLALPLVLAAVLAPRVVVAATTGRRGNGTPSQ